MKPSNYDNKGKMYPQNQQGGKPQGGAGAGMGGKSNQQQGGNKYNPNNPNQQGGKDKTGGDRGDQR